jgi:hypothetical protein
MAAPVYTIESTVPITSSSVANPSVILTPVPHGLVTGDSVVISGHSGSTPSINTTYTVTVIDGDQFSIPQNVTVGGTGGQLQVQRKYQGGSINCAQPWKDVDTLGFDHVSTTGLFRFQQWQKVYLKKNGTVIFGGLVSRVDEQAQQDRALSLDGIRCRITAQGFKTMASWMTFTGSFAEEDAGIESHGAGDRTCLLRHHDRHGHGTPARPWPRKPTTTRAFSASSTSCLLKRPGSGRSIPPRSSVVCRTGNDDMHRPRDL